MDLVLKSALTEEQCRRRLDQVLVKYGPQLPLWNWPLQKMIGSRQGSDFTCALYFSGTRRSSMQRLRLNATLSANGTTTVIQGNFDTDNWEFYLDAASIYFTALSITGLLITLMFCVSDVIRHAFNAPIWALMGFFTVSVSIGLWIWQRIPRTLENGKKGVAQFLMRSLNAQENAGPIR